ncbi:hypothetical protein K1W54_04385 [Micromonospora sp. CPCC 205371]|nr:hypothetical protein [Micromonospora sp. CPCC 205371]
MNRSIGHQDAADSLGIFQDGLLIEAVPDDDNWGNAYDLRDQLADAHGVDRARYEVLKRCPEHPDVSAVDCIDCVPLD